MDFVANNAETSIAPILMPTFNAFLPLLEKNRQSIQSVRRETMKYGKTDRHMLDVYYPQTSKATKPPILIFAYGGGFTSGERVRPPPADLVYTNVGAFFASRGLLTVIPDYRLVPEVKYPQPVEDINDALAYVVANLGEAGDTDKVFLYGHSAGASIVSSLYLHEPSLLGEGLRAHVKGIATLGAPFIFEGPDSRVQDSILQYYGDAYERLCPYGLLKSASSETLAGLPPLFVMRAEKEPRGLVICHERTLELLKEKGITDVSSYIAMGHNHISPGVALSSGEGEEWGNKLVAWVKEHLS
ncbi:alpha/beta-hydrolase [Schizopora paradoxa]|uniref:Alpha/beta-hydrolase n=1 Tax=Schizopora paradoxa TaxID=27342 RepID=A0A0H2R9U4_9AGAM|nr:alpha/beta-hydrolase [Schizopora paradoxa]